MNVSNLPMQTFKEIPQPNSDAQSIVALQKKSGRVVGYKLSDGQILEKQQAVTMARQGGIKGVGIAQRSGNEYLKALPDGEESNNLGSLPTVK